MSSGISQASMNLQFIKEATSMGSSISNSAATPSQPTQAEEAVYATEGDANYDEAMDADSDGTITYEEYLDYVQQNLSSAASASIAPASTSVKAQTDDAGTVQPINAGKALSAYSNAAAGAASLNSAVISAES